MVQGHRKENCRAQSMKHDVPIKASDPREYCTWNKVPTYVSTCSHRRPYGADEPAALARVVGRGAVSSSSQASSLLLAYPTTPCHAPGNYSFEILVAPLSRLPVIDLQHRSAVVRLMAKMRPAKGPLISSHGKETQSWCAGR